MVLGQRSFGYLLRRYRLAALLTQEQLAERAHLSYRTISDLERGANQTPRRDTVLLLADALELSSEDRAALIAAAHPVEEQLEITDATVRASTSPRLIAVSGPHQGADFPLFLPCSIGRAADGNQIVLGLDRSVSRHHAVVKRDDRGVVVVEDLESQNGTSVNEQRVDIMAVHDGDLLTLGDTRLVIKGVPERPGS
jgi:transcriptional regulator with XRE-family HTH domain